ncbi:MAG: DUF1232 domain-containing protein [Rudaea sp.]|uniref:YkvA family protein n=1 Tax=unclassified Rudaea TaxID=2627037 RepID=UPI0010F7543E|nr:MULTISPECIES: YkvA family protein [unclassified Rudaea]MBN8886896.1 DUF1232 domain-containing protein [Rudaea sp.]
MSLQITIDLKDSDLQYFIDAAKRAQAKAGNLTPKQITDAASKLLVESKSVNVPEFIAARLSKLDAMIGMVNDAGWALSEEDKKRVLSALTYFAEPEDVIPDSVPVLGFLDDAIMIELCQRELKHEIDAYEEFVAHRAAEAAHRKVNVDTVKMERVDWLEDRRAELQARMASRRRDSYVPTSFSQALFRFT